MRGFPLLLGISSSSTRQWSLCSGSSKGTNLCNAAAEIGWRSPTGSPVACKTDPGRRALARPRVSLPIGPSLRHTASWVHCLLCSQHTVFTGKDSSQVTVITDYCDHCVTCSQEYSFTVLAEFADCVAMNLGVGEEIGH